MVKVENLASILPALQLARVFDTRWWLRWEGATGSSCTICSWNSGAALAFSREETVELGNVTG